MGYGKLSNDQIRILEDIPASAVELQAKDKVNIGPIQSLANSQNITITINKPINHFNHSSPQYLRKLNRQERVVEEVKLILKPHYNKKHITKEEYKDIMRRAVPKVRYFSSLWKPPSFSSSQFHVHFQICHNPTGEINPKKIKNLIEAYVKKFRYRRKGVAVTAKSN